METIPFRPRYRETAQPRDREPLIYRMYDDEHPEPPKPPELIAEEERDFEPSRGLRDDGPRRPWPWITLGSLFLLLLLEVVTVVALLPATPV